MVVNCLGVVKELLLRFDGQYDAALAEHLLQQACNVYGGNLMLLLFDLLFALRDRLDDGAPGLALVLQALIFTLVLKYLNKKKLRKKKHYMLSDIYVMYSTHTHTHYHAHTTYTTHTSIKHTPYTLLAYPAHLHTPTTTTLLLTI